MSKQKVQNYLHELIKNLSQTEKRYFKLLAKQQTPGKKNDYIKLFEEIDKQDKFDEEKIREKFKGTPIEKRYASLKKYLYELVIKSLTFYNSETISSIKVRRMLDAAEILQQKGLHHQAIRKLKKADLVAEELGMSFLQYEIRQLLMDCILISEHELEVEEFNAFKKKQNSLTESITVTNKIQSMRFDIEFQSEIENEKPEFKTALFSIENKIKDNPNKLLFFSTISNHSKSVKNTEKARIYDALNVDLFNDGKLNRKTLPSNFINAILNKLEGLNFNKDRVEIFSLLNISIEFFEDTNNSYYNKNNDYAHLLALELNFALQSEDLISINQTSEKVKDYLSNKRNKLNPSIHKSLVYYLSWSEIKNKKFKSALIFSNDILRMNQMAKSKKGFAEAVIQNIIIHYELKNFSYLEFAIKSFAKELKKRSEFSASESVVFEFFFNNLGEIGSSSISTNVMFKLLAGQYEAKKTKSENHSFLLLNWIKEKSEKATEEVFNL